MTRGGAVDAQPPELRWGARSLDLPDSTTATARRLHGSMSGAGVFGLSLPTEAAVLKVTMSLGDPRRLLGAHRELTFYRTASSDPRWPVPKLLGQHESPAGVAVLLSAHLDAPHSTPWRGSDWDQLATDLARLHDSVPPTTHRAYDGVLTALRAPGLDVLVPFWSRPGEPEALEAVLAGAAALEDAVGALAPAVVHGDCHLGNVLRQDDSA